MIRLGKFLAACGVGARRKADELIAAGAVAVDGVTARLGMQIDPSAQRVTVRGRRVMPPPDEHVTLVLNKPKGVVTTMSDERGRKAVAALLPKGRRVFPVGRLDAQTSGVLLCTSDGELARILMHPSFGVEKRYRVRAEGSDGPVAFEITLREGKNRQIRRMCAQRGLRVLALTRVSFGPIELRSLKEGATRPLTSSEKSALERIRDSALKGRLRHEQKQKPPWM